jgi:DNA-binding NtrC family response regulator
MRARVLIVHDVSAIRLVVARALEEDGCTAIGVEDYRLAADLLAVDPPDVILTDERIFNSHPDAFQAMRDLFPAIVVVALAAPPHHRDGGIPGVHCTIEKPPKDQDLLRAVRWALELSDSDSPERSA